MKYFLDFINSGDHFTYVSSSYCIVFLILFLILKISSKKTRKLESEFTSLLKNETKK